MPKSTQIHHHLHAAAGELQQQQQQQRMVVTGRRGLASSPSTLHSITQSSQMMMMSTGAATSSCMSAPPRKVSFEDGQHSDSDSGNASASESSSSSIVPLHYCEEEEQEHHQQQAHGEPTKEVRLSRSKPPRLLARHSPSLSLVDLARTCVAMDDETNTAGGEESSSSSSSSSSHPSRKNKRPHSAPVSPVSGVIVDPARCLLLPPGIIMESPATATATAEPWGHFVDMALPEKKKLRRVPKTIPLSARASNKSSSINNVNCSNSRKRHARRKYAHPYGEYHHTKLCFQPTTTSKSGSESAASLSFDLSLPIPSMEECFSSSLQPRKKKEPTEQIAGDLERLHFDESTSF